ncbi:hypothetical protein B0H19DRAFT_1073230 [Mycena capillaripes]|nr:hypothetical protein B0H19DRAFT_1073230 [Mycena capillaripes]
MSLNPSPGCTLDTEAVEAPFDLKIFLEGSQPAAPQALPTMPATGDNSLWWKVVLACIACDMLAIPGVSIAVEHLFSSSKHTMSDARLSMAAAIISVTVVAKELLNTGFGQESRSIKYH